MSDQYINLRLTPVLVTRPHLLLPTQEHCCSVTQLCSTLCDPMDCSMPGFPVLHHLLELAQTHVHWVSDTIQPSCPLSYPSPLDFNLSQHQGLVWESALRIRWPKYWSFSLSISPSNEYSGFKSISPAIVPSPFHISFLFVMDHFHSIQTCWNTIQLKFLSCFHMSFKYCSNSQFLYTIKSLENVVSTHCIWLILSFFIPTPVTSV